MIPSDRLFVPLGGFPGLEGAQRLSLVDENLVLLPQVGRNG